MDTLKGENKNENDALDAITNLINATTGDRVTIVTLTATNATHGKQHIKLYAKLVVPVDKLATRGSEDKRKILMLVKWIKKQQFIKKYTHKIEGHKNETKESDKMRGSTRTFSLPEVGVGTHRVS